MPPAGGLKTPMRFLRAKRFCRPCGGGLDEDRAMKAIIALLLFIATTAAARAQPHACAADAIAKADQLLRFHGEIQAGQPAAVDENVKVLPPVKALRGNGRFDVLDVWGHIYKADYRMRLIYAQIKGSCALMGQEILEASDPY
jgi:hypothetical protein